MTKKLPSCIPSGLTTWVRGAGCTTAELSSFLQPASWEEAVIMLCTSSHGIPSGMYLEESSENWLLTFVSNRLKFRAFWNHIGIWLHFASKGDKLFLIYGSLKNSPPLNSAGANVSLSRTKDHLAFQGALELWWILMSQIARPHESQPCLPRLLLASYLPNMLSGT